FPVLRGGLLPVAPLLFHSPARMVPSIVEPDASIVKEEYFMRKLICLAAVLGGSLLPMAPPAEAQRALVVRPPPGHLVRFSHRGRWYNHRRFRGGHWFHW